MCGIVGAYKPQGGEVCQEDTLVAMRERMVHRGPDGAGVWREREGRCGFAHRRLSIIDLSDSAAQPMSNADGSVVIVFNGEIYNHAELRAELEKLGKYQWKTDHSDTEVLLHGFEEWGLGVIDRLYGMFAFAVYDIRNPDHPVLHMVRDRAGVKPLYIARTDSGEWLFASEIRALMAHPHMSAELDRTAFWHYLTFIVAPAPLTMFRGVFKLPAAHTVTIDHQGAAKARCYWDSTPDTGNRIRERDLGFDDAVAELTRLLKTSIARRMVSDVPFGVLLSGGVDSSLNVALMSELMDRPVKTFTVGYEGYEDFNEFQHARRVSDRYGTDHHETMISEKEVLDFLPQMPGLQDEPIADNVCIPLYFLAGLVKQTGTTVVQVGEGADEHFLGYWWCEDHRAKEEAFRKGNKTSWWRRFFGGQAAGLTGADDEFSRRAQAGEQLFWGGATAWVGDQRRLLTPDPAPFVQGIDCPIDGLLPDGHRGLDSHEIIQGYLGGLDGRVGNPETPYKIPYLESKVRLPEHLLMRVDKMTMAHSVEARVPFLDHDIIDFAMRLPASYKLENGLGKRLLKKAAEPYVDHDLLYRRKQGFGAPLDQWMTRGDFGKYCLDAFERSPIRGQGFLDNDYFGSILRDQVEGRANNGFLVWTVLNAILWHETCIGD
ncbi:MAG: asparagine synthase (glutamine-hydrolyzing) [Rhodospirillales bacterium]|nr:asparagine synthase (glutamine-hydrolyzing) [Rhodospirillales bacterium]